jgi:hypothetical protein
MKTAVEFLLEKYKSQNTLLFGEDFEQAKEMEKEQIIDAREALFHGTPEQYYNETFKTKKNDRRTSKRH